MYTHLYTLAIMFASSTQRKYWTYSGETELNNARKDVNEKYLLNHGANNMSENDRVANFLTVAEERVITRHFEHVLREFCNRFQPPMPKYVTGTALCYFKRFYVKHSPMDYHPKDIMLTCVYLACKVEEFNVSIGQFVGNLKGDRDKFANIILSFELLLMEKLHYHLTIHSPFRPLEGLLIDIKTRCKLIDDAEILRPAAEDFMDKSLATDACLIFSPSQIALAAIVYSASRRGINIDSYITEMLFKGTSQEDVKRSVYQIKRIKYIVKSHEPLQKTVVGQVQKKLESCRNQENNPDSEIYKRKLQEMLDDDEEIQTKKRKKISEKEKKLEKELLQ